MPLLRVHNFSVSLDGFAAGPDQGVDDPLGRGGERLHDWIFRTRFGRAMLGQGGGSDGVDQQYAADGVEGIGATIMGRNMFGPVRGPWPDAAWRGWWGGDPPFHHPVFVLTHHLRPAVPMDGGTVFHFIDAEPAAALSLAFEAAGGLDVRLGGGASTVRQFLAAGLVDRLHVAVVPVLLGGGERLFDDGVGAGYSVSDPVVGDGVVHLQLSR